MLRDEEVLSDSTTDEEGAFDTLNAAVGRCLRRLEHIEQRRREGAPEEELEQSHAELRDALEQWLRAEEAITGGPLPRESNSDE